MPSVIPMPPVSAGRDAFTSQVVDSLFVGETENIGNPVTPEEKAYGRSLPKRRIPDFPIRGYEYYDYRHDVINTTFVNYKDNAQARNRRAFVADVHELRRHDRQTPSRVRSSSTPSPCISRRSTRRFDNDNRGGVAWRTAGFQDLDGSVGGMPNSYVLIHDGENDSVATDDTCKIQPTWNAAVCTGDVGRLFLNKPGGTLAAVVCRGARHSSPQWQGPQGHGQPEQCALRHRDAGEYRKTGNLPQREGNGQRLMGHV